MEDLHWAQYSASKIIKEKGDKDLYVLSSGITPSGVVHFGNFRETISVDLVARALKQKGKKVKFIFSWDDFDTFRKIPKNIPHPELLEKYIHQPIVDTPDPYGVAANYAQYHKQNYEAEIEAVGITVEKISQSQKYRHGDYAEQIKLVLDKKEQVKEILNKYRTTKLADDWLPVSLYCEKCNRDNLRKISYDSNNTTLHYTCSCGHQGEEALDKSTRIKLPWRLDWPMRWAYEKVDFEPGGKDHSSEGGSYTTSKEIVQSIFNYQPPVYMQYDFISIKGAGGKMSSSLGNLVTLSDVLKIYTPNMIRYIFASYKSNVDIAFSFGLDVLKTYEDFDQFERIVWGTDIASNKKTAMAKVVYDLAILNPPTVIPFRPSFRHLCNVLQINDLNIARSKYYYKDFIKNDYDDREFDERCKCALNWLAIYAPDEFKLRLNSKMPDIDISPQGKQLVNYVRKLVANSDELSDKDIHAAIYDFLQKNNMDAASSFATFYQLLIGKDKGPKLANFIKTMGKDRFLGIIDRDL
jgi:lysyl-tRNA synthetase class 1